jgi:hypothetical protein
LHIPGDEYWLQFGHPPVEITKNLFELPKLDSGMKFLSISLVEKNFIKHSTKTNPCSQENNEALRTCVRSKLKDIFRENCTIPGNKLFHFRPKSKAKLTYSHSALL